VSDFEIVAEWEAAKATGMSREEFAALKGITQGALGGKLQRAKKKLQKDNQVNLSTEYTSPVRVELDGNVGEVHFYTGQPITLEDLVEKCDIDLSVWRIENWKPRWWDAVIRRADDTNAIHRLYGAWASVVKRSPEPHDLIIRPATVNVNIQDFEKSQKGAPGLKTALCIPDLQGGFSRDIYTGKLTPFHDRNALDIALQIAYDYPFDNLVILGDYLDATEWTDKFLRMPEYYWTTQPTIVEMAWWLTQFSLALPRARKHKIEGNHEFRYREQVIKHLKASYRLKPANELTLPDSLSVPRLLDLAGSGYEWIGDYPAGKVWLTKTLHCAHGHLSRNPPGATARAIIENSDSSVIFGHIHRRERATITRYGPDGPRELTAVCSGFLGHLDRVPSGRRSLNWQQGVTVAYHSEEYERISTIDIQNGRAYFNNKMYHARPNIDEITNDVISDAMKTISN
jgi:hypothetical protein